MHNKPRAAEAPSARSCVCQSEMHLRIRREDVHEARPQDLRLRRGGLLALDFAVARCGQRPAARPADLHCAGHRLRVPLRRIDVHARVLLPVQPFTVVKGSMKQPPRSAVSHRRAHSTATASVATGGHAAAGGQPLLARSNVRTAGASSLCDLRWSRPRAACCS